MTFLSPKSHTYIHLPTKSGYTKCLYKRKQENYIIHPMHSGETKNRPLHDLDNKIYT